MQIEKLHTPEEVVAECAVVIDVLRAFTTAAFAFSVGAHKIIPVADPEEAFELKRQNANYLLMGEMQGIRPNMPLFDYFYGVALRDLAITKGLDSFKKPVFLALGRYDFIVAPPSLWDSFRDKFKDLTCRVFERSGHSPQYEEAHNFNKELITWFKKHQ